MKTNETGRETRSVTVTAVPTTAYYHFVGWTGDVASTDNPLELSMDSSKTVWPIFAENIYSNSIPASWFLQYGLPPGDDTSELDSDGDGILNWEERIANTDPTNANSRLEITEIMEQASGRTVSWTAVTGRSYTVLYRTNLLASDAWTPLSEKTTEGRVLDTVNSGESLVFYQLQVRLIP